MAAKKTRLSLALPLRFSEFPPSPRKVNCSSFAVVAVVGAKLRSRLIADTNHRDFDAAGLVCLQPPTPPLALVCPLECMAM